MTALAAAAQALPRERAQPPADAGHGARRVPSRGKAASGDRSALNLATFDAVWSLVADTHFDPELGGVDWNAVRDELRPRAQAATSDHQLRGVLEEMIGRLGQSHFAILAQGGSSLDGESAHDADPLDDSSSPPDRAAQSGQPAAPGDPDFRHELLGGCDPRLSAEILARLDGPAAEGDLGLETRLLAEGEVVVTRVRPDGPAARAGVTAGWVLDAVDGATLAAGLECMEQLGGGRFHSQIVGGWLGNLLGGAPGSAVRLLFASASGDTVELVLERERPPGEPIGFGDLPPAPFRFEVEAATTPAGATVSVVRFNLWLLPVAPALEQAMPALRRSAGVIIDLRGNPGGVAAIAQGVASHFIDRTVSLGALRSRRDDLELVVEPRRVARDGSRVEPYAGPLAILIDGGSASTSEVFAAGLRDHDRARLFGEPSAGAALPAVTDRLPNGDVFLHASMDYLRPSGEPIEGRPLRPDVETGLTRADLAAGRDAALMAALEWIDAELGRRAAPNAPSSAATAAGPASPDARPTREHPLEGGAP